jgi:hypothetical protein
MALLSFVDSTPRAYRLKASNAAPPISTFPGTIPHRPELSLQRFVLVFYSKLESWRQDLKINIGPGWRRGFV